MSWETRPTQAHQGFFDSKAQKCPEGEVPLVFVPRGTPGGHPSDYKSYVRPCKAPQGDKHSGHLGQRSLLCSPDFWQASNNNDNNINNNIKHNNSNNNSSTSSNNPRPFWQVSECAPLGEPSLPAVMYNMHMYICYIYIYIEREVYIHMSVYIYIYIYVYLYVYVVYICIIYIYIYICIYNTYYIYIYIYICHVGPCWCLGSKSARRLPVGIFRGPLVRGPLIISLYDYPYLALSI